MATNLASSEYVMHLADSQATLETVGGKGASLARLKFAGLPVPDGFHITTAAYHQFVTQNDLQPDIQAALEQVDINQPATLGAAATTIRELFADARTPPEIASAIATAYAELSGRDPVVAVRSSATAEDLPGASFAGQQETYLNVQGTAEVLKAVKRCWASLWTARAIGYRARQGIHAEGLSLAVVVQTLVPAEAAGILFTANPVTGSRDQVVISASWGLGEAVVSGLVTPDALTLDKASGATLEQQIAEKQVMTARVNGGTQEQPVPDELQSAPVLDHEASAELVRLGVQIENLYGMPMDVEWALADGNFYIVQARPITGLPEAIVPPPGEWQPPEPKGRYMRTSIVDLMPDPLSPLFATMGASIYNECIQQMMADVTGSRKTAFPDDLIVTIQDYAYYKVNFSAREWWALLSGLAPRLPGLIRMGPNHFREVALPEYRQKVKGLDQKPIAEMTAVEIWRDARELTAAAMDHLSILQVDTLGAAAGSEGLFTAIYNKFFKQEDAPPASAFVMGYNTTPIRAEKSLYDLAQWALEQPTLSKYVLKTGAAEIASAVLVQEAPEGVGQAEWIDWTQQVEAHLKSFGYMLFDLDFAKPTPAEDPTPQLETVKMYMQGEGANPYERQGRLEKRREQAREQLLERARGLRGWALRKALGWAQSLAQVREDSIASIGLAYPRLRELLKELGRRMVEAGAISTLRDIFWLKEAEVVDRLESLDQGARLESMQEVIKKRKKIHQAERKIMPPTQLPYSKTYMGIPLEVFIPGEGGQEGDHLKGVGASSGKITGVACVLQGPEDFDQMQPGGILIAKLTTPAWTPLFAMAAGVVTDIGGPLSHGSIVAREYGIPAVLGTVMATRIIQSGQTITVDGDAGEVTLVG
jgi:phosphohistidine swiveling domain-containing protein